MDPALPQPGELLSNRYAIDREIGRGGMSAIFAARDTVHDRPVAIKVLLPHVTPLVGGARFVREIRVVARLQHPHVVPLLDSGLDGTTPYYVMPLLDGPSLRTLLKRETQLGFDDVVRIVRDIADALDHAHRAGVVHRDIKPENVMLAEGRARVVDFGVAKALDVASDERLTDSGVAIGTIAYMSPEQATGRSTVDGRADVYALGCVAYEMLTGAPPFSGATVQAIMARHLSDAPGDVRTVRPTVPNAANQAVQRALAKVPADRFRTATQFADALESGLRALADRRSPVDRLGVPAAVLALTLVGLIVLGLVMAQRGGLDATRVVVARPSVRSSAGLPDAWLNALRYHLQERTSLVPHVTVEEPARVEDRLRRLPTGEPELADWLDLSRHLGAGRLLVPEVISLPDSLVVRLVMYDVSTRRPARGHERGVAAGGRADDANLQRPVSGLVERLFDLPDRALGGAAPASSEAILAYAQARRAIDEAWDFTSAERALLQAIALDDQYVPPRWWLAQLRAWRGDDADAWLAHAQRAVTGLRAIGDSGEAQLADALTALGEGRYPDACGRYRALIAKDSTRFRAWLGLGICHARDPIVLPDPSSPTGWRFRGSLATAVRAHRRALAVVPSFHFAFASQAYERLTGLLFIRASQARRGYAADDSSRVFFSRVSLHDDTLAYFPVPLADFVAIESIPANVYEALDRNRRALVEITRAWMTAFPDAWEPRHALALALDGVERIEGPGSALEQTGLARARLDGDRNDAVRLAFTETALHLKAGAFGTVRRLADSVLAVVTDPDSMEAGLLAVMAAMIGRADRAAELLAVAARDRAVVEANTFGATPVPLPVLEARERLRGYVAVGADSATVTRSFDQVWERLEIHVQPPARRAVVARELLADAYEWAFPVVGLGPFHGAATRSYLGRLQIMVASGQEAAAIARLRDRLDTRQTAEFAVGVAFQEAWILTRAGDTALASAHLDRTLAALPVMSLRFLTDPRHAAAIGRCMALRIQLAAAVGERGVIQQWRPRLDALRN